MFLLLALYKTGAMLHNVLNIFFSTCDRLLIRDKTRRESRTAELSAILYEKFF